MIIEQKSRDNRAGIMSWIRREELWALAFLFIIFLLRFVFILRYHVNSDEPQHLHIVWAWTHGLLPYRDVFDNHSPLYSFLWSPFFHWFGERPNIIVLMRLTEIPCYCLALWAVYRIGVTLFDRRAALWGIILGGLFPVYFCCSLEFRPDGLWAACWFLALAVLVEGRLSLPRSLFVGFLLGVTMAISMKTVLMLIALGIGVLVVVVAAARNGWKIPFGRIGLNILAGLAGFVILPAAVIGFFALQDALPSLYYGTIGHNLLAKASNHLPFLLRTFFFTVGMLACICLAFIIMHRSQKVEMGGRRVLILVVTISYWLMLICYWPLLQREHYLPFYPLLMILLAGAIFSVPRGQSTWLLPRFYIPVGLVAMELAYLLFVTPPWKSKTKSEVLFLSQVLALTDSSDTIMDKKGETIFRHRPFYFALEKVSSQAIIHGIIPDDIPQCLVASNTCVAVCDKNSGYSRSTRAFIEKNYIPISRLRVAGVSLHFTTPKPVPFDIVIPARYAVVTPHGAARGRLDGEPYQGPLFLPAGHHEYTPAEGESLTAVMWAQAVERNFLPKEFKNP